VLAQNTAVEGLKITLASGERVWRPMGLTDVPGGAASAGFYAVLFGLGFFLNDRSLPVRLLACLSMGIGLFCIYLSQVRSMLVLVAVSMIVFALVLGKRGELGRFVGIAMVVPAIVFISFSWAVSIGGDGVSQRVATLLEDRPGTVYYLSRGHFLEHTVNELLPQYPLGAGLGRWGMINHYFGDNSNPETAAIWAEIQWTGWLLDGGVPLVVCYTVAVLLACWVAWRISQRSARGTLELWAALILGYDIGALALTFNYPVFIGQLGMEFWFLNGCLFAAAVKPSRSGLLKSNPFRAPEPLAHLSTATGSAGVAP
jgi:hypothetical protein